MESRARLAAHHLRPDDFGAYFAIPLTLASLVRRRRDVPFPPIFWLSAIFIFSCGFGHLIEASIFWKPWYRLAGAVKLVTAAASWLTVIALIRVLPEALKLPDRARMAEQLEKEVAEHTRAEEQLRRQARLLELTSDVMVVCDLEGRIISWNRGAEHQLGWSRSEAVGQNMEALLKSECSTPLPQIMKQLDQSGHWQGEIIQTSREGRRIVMDSRWSLQRDAQGRPEAVFLISNDITEQKRAAQQFKAVVEAAPSAMIMLDRQGIIRLVNAQTEKLFGHSREALLGRSVEMLIPERFCGRHVQYRNDFFTAPQARPMGAGRDLYGLRADGVEVPVEIGLNPMDTADGTFVLASIIDITERLRAEREIVRLNADLEKRVEERTAQLAAANRELESFSYSVSHDLRAPLRAIEGFTAIFVENYGDQFDEEGRRLMEIVRTNVRRMGQMVEDFLRLARVGREPLHLARLDMNRLVEAVVVENVDRAAHPNLSIEVHPLPEARADAGLLRQVWSNLITNAVKFSRHREQPRIEIGGRIENDQALYRVLDNGAGFDMATRENFLGIFSACIRSAISRGPGLASRWPTALLSVMAGASGRRRPWIEGRSFSSPCRCPPDGPGFFRPDRGPGQRGPRSRNRRISATASATVN